MGIQIIGNGPYLLDQVFLDRLNIMLTGSGCSPGVLYLLFCLGKDILNITGAQLLLIKAVLDICQKLLMSFECTSFTDDVYLR